MDLDVAAFSSRVRNPRACPVSRPSVDNVLAGGCLPALFDPAPGSRSLK